MITGLTKNHENILNIIITNYSRKIKNIMIEKLKANKYDRRIIYKI